MATDTIGPGFLIAIVSAFDAYKGANHYNATGKTRGVTAGVWILLAVVMVLVTAGIAVNGNGDDSSSSGGGSDYQVVPCSEYPDAIGC